MRIRRIGIYITGMISVSLGIVLCAKCGLGISPVSSWPYVMEGMVPLSFGMLTMLFHFINILFQYGAERKLINPQIFLQIPMAVVMGILIDLIKTVIQIETDVLVNQILALGLSVVFTAFGMMCMINMGLIQNPPDGTVRQICIKTGKELGGVKIVYDAVMVASSCLLSYLVLGEFRGLGIATIVSAIFVGKVLSWLQKIIGVPIKKVGNC